MGVFTIGIKLKLAAWVIAIIIVSLNIRLVLNIFDEYYSSSTRMKDIILFLGIPLFVAAMTLLGYITIKPLLTKNKTTRITTPHAQ